MNEFMFPSEGWALILEGERIDLDDLREQLVKPFDPWVEDYADDGRSVLLLRSAAWATLTNAREVMADATRLISLISAAAMLHFSDTRPVRLGGIRKFKNDGSQDRVLVAATLNVTLDGGRVRGRATVVGAPINSPAPSPMQIRLGRAENDERVSDVFSFLTRADNWFDLFKAMESLEACVPGGMRMLMSKHSRWEDVRRTANHARHSPAKQHSLPGNPPTFAEARGIVIAVAADAI